MPVAQDQRRRSPARPPSPSPSARRRTRSAAGPARRSNNDRAGSPAAPPARCRSSTRITLIASSESDPFVGPQRAHEEMARDCATTSPRGTRSTGRAGRGTARPTASPRRAARRRPARHRCCWREELAHEAPDQHLQGRPVDQLERARPRAAQEIEIAQHHRPRPAPARTRLADTPHAPARQSGSARAPRAMSRNTSSRLARP